MLDQVMPDPRRRRGLMLVMSSPSGAGKTSISRRVLELEPELTLSISVTTRPQRPGEVDGVHYHFIEQARFDAMVAGGELLEHALVYGHSYGTPRAAVERALSSGRDVLFDIDWQGADQIADKMPDDSVRVFILPPSWSDLQRRLKARAQDSVETMRARLRLGHDEIMHWGAYDYVIVNKNFDRAYADLGHIYRAERMKPGRNPWLPGFVEELLAEDVYGDVGPPPAETTEPAKPALLRPVQK